MESSGDLAEYIKKEITKSGFPLEIYTATILNKKGWTVLPHLFYPQEDNIHDRELDIHAKKQHEEFSDVQDMLIIECKKQEKKPWVFFQQDSVNQDILCLNVSPLNAYANMTQRKIFDYLKTLPCFKEKPCTYHFPMFDQKNYPDPIHEALNQVIDALLYCWDMEIQLFQELAHKKTSLLYPVIVLDGLLFKAHIEVDGNINLEETKHLQLKVNKALKKPLISQGINNSLVLSIKPISVDIITKGYLEQYLDNY